MKALTLAFLTQCYREGCDETTRPTHIRLNSARKAEISNLLARAPGLLSAPCVGAAQIVFSSEVAQDAVEIINIEFLNPVNRSTGKFDTLWEARSYTFTREIISEPETCPCCGAVKVRRV